jgi:hypothetical protein
MPIYQGFYSGLKCRHHWNHDKTGIEHKDSDEEESESWITLFIDLVYVAMFMNVGFIMEYCGENYEVVAYAFVIFLIMFNSRDVIDTYANRFFANDLFHRLVYFVYSYGVFIMTLNINYTYKAYTHRSLAISHIGIGRCPYIAAYWQGFAYGFFITRISLFMLYSMICYYDKDAFRQFSIKLFGFATSTLLMACAIFFEDGSRNLFIATAIVEVLFLIFPNVLIMLNTIFPSVPTLPEIYPMDVYEHQRRLGVFYMMTLGR